MKHYNFIRWTMLMRPRWTSFNRLRFFFCFSYIFLGSLSYQYRGLTIENFPCRAIQPETTEEILGIVCSTRGNFKIEVLESVFVSNRSGYIFDFGNPTYWDDRMIKMSSSDIHLNNENEVNVTIAASLIGNDDFGEWAKQDNNTYHGTQSIYIEAFLQDRQRRATSMLSALAHDFSYAFAGFIIVFTGVIVYKRTNKSRDFEEQPVSIRVCRELPIHRVHLHPIKLLSNNQTSYKEMEDQGEASNRRKDDHRIVIPSEENQC